MKTDFGTRSFLASLASELLADARSSKLPPALSIGMVMTVLMIVCQLSVAAIIFSGALAPFAPRAIGSVLFGTFTLCLVTALIAPYKGILSMPLFAPTAALFAIGGTVSTSMSGALDEAMFVTMIVIMGLSTVMTAVFFLIVGRLRMANLFLSIPYPVTGGFLAGLGWFLAVGGFSVMCGVSVNWETLPRLLESDMIWKWVPGVLGALGLLCFVKRRPHFLVLPIALILATALYHAALGILGFSAEEAREAGVLFRGVPTGSLWPPFGAGDLTLVDWSIVAIQIPGMLSVALITLMCIVLNASGLELSCGVEMDMSKEFRAEGVANLLAGLGGSPPGGNTSVFSVVTHTTGAETRLSGIIAAAPVGLVLLFGGFALEVFPTPVLGGLLLFFGLDMMYEWLVVVREKLSRADYGIVLVIATVTGVAGFLEGVAVGLAAAVVFFVMRASRVDVIADSFTGRDRLSKRSWPATHRAILRLWGERMRAYRLRGYLFFGSATAMGDRLKKALAAEPAPQCLLLDLAGITGLDASAVNVFCRIIRTARPLDTKIILSALPARFESTLRRSLPESDWKELLFEEDLDHALERSELLIIAEWRRLNGESKDARTELFGISVDDAMHQLERQAQFEDLADRLQPWLQSNRYAADEIIVAQGEKQEHMQLLVQGRATMVSEKSGERLGEYGPGSVFAPHAAFGNHVALSTVKAAEPCQTVLMTRADYESLERKDPELALELSKYLVHTVLDDQTRLTFAAAKRDTGAEQEA